jgi:hypothetical protein
LSGSTADLGTHEGFQLKKGEIPGRSAKISIKGGFLVEKTLENTSCIESP